MKAKWLDINSWSFLLVNLQFSLEREIDLAKQEIEKQKLELLKAEELKKRNQEYDLIAKQIVKLSSRKKTQK